jgi:type II secretory ATPase GspE/PulE/Tfp pilus assembly ATPase PilB-like protein
VDGILHEISTFPAHMHAAVMSRMKVMAHLDIAERRIPQDGRMQLGLTGRTVDLRVSTYPTYLGEKLVVRVLDRAQVQIDLEEVGLEPDTLTLFKDAIERPTGIVLFTGPTGSGKTTTLYAALRRIASPEKNVMTVEDPIEYFLDVVNQSQVNVRAGLTFASGLRSILRQDPDVIMVGEIRDTETAEMAIRAALTGHLVFSTLHTNDAAGAVMRLIDMGIEPFLPASAVTAVLAQRLVRKVCDACAETCEPAPGTIARLGVAIPPGATIRRGRGCRACRDTGFAGRTGIFELLRMTPAIEDLVASKARPQAIAQLAAASGMRRLREDGVRKAARGITTLEEVIKVT